MTGSIRTLDSRSLWGRDKLTDTGLVSDRSRVVLVVPGPDHPPQDLHSVGADVPRCVDGLLCHHLTVDQHSSARLTDGYVQLQKRKHELTRGLVLAGLNITNPFQTHHATPACDVPQK